MAEVVEVLRDSKRAQSIVDTAFREVALNPENSFAAMVQQVDGAINRAFCEEMAAKKSPYDERAVAAILRGGSADIGKSEKCLRMFAGA